MRKLILSIFIFGGLAYGLQDAGQRSLADVARENKKEKPQMEPKTVVVADERGNRPGQNDGALMLNDRRDESPSRLPDLVLQGGSNIEDIVQSLETIKQQRGQVEADAALHRWYAKYDAMLVDALQIMDGVKPNPNGPGAAAGVQNVAAVLRIQSAFLRMVSEFPKLGFRPGWFSMHCSASNMAPCH
jgi:hypothetical protein